jgi:ABC-type uncharacterized transport system permease subunit
MDFNTILQILDSTLRLTPPLLLACLAGLYSERAGVFDIGLEGKMLVAAFFAGAVAAVSGYAWVGLAAAIAASTVMALLHGFASITLRGNQLISGVAINFLAAGGTALIGLNWFRQGTQTPQLNGSARFSEITLCRPVVRPLDHLVYRLSGGAVHMVVAVSHPFRLAPARRRRKPRGRGHSRNFGDLDAISCSDYHRHFMRHRRGLSVHMHECGVRQEHDRR